MTLLTWRAEPGDVMLWEGRRREAALLGGRSELALMSLAELLLEEPGGVVVADVDVAGKRCEKLALLGCRVSRDAELGEIWMLGTPAFPRRARGVAKLARRFLQPLAELYDLERLETLVRETDGKAGRYARLVGFEPSETLRDLGPAFGRARVFQWLRETKG